MMLGWMKRGLGASALRRSAKALEFRQASVYRITGSRLRGRGAVASQGVARVNPLPGEAVTRLHAGAVIRQAGYDGEYGVF
jgi:hypothetical protein